MSIAAASVQVLDASVPVRRIWECPIPVIRGAMVELTGSHQAAEFSVVLDDQYGSTFSCCACPMVGASVTASDETPRGAQEDPRDI